MGRRLVSLLVATFLLHAHLAAAQGLTGDLIGTVKDAQGGVLPGVIVRISSPALIGGQASQTTNDKGQFRFLALPPALYVLDVELQGFAPCHDADIRIGAGATIERPCVLQVAGLAESLVVEGTGSRLDAREVGFGTRFGNEDLQTIPTRRSSMFDWIRNAPGISATSPTSGTSTTISAFGSGTNENQFLFDGTNFTCPCNGIARAEPGIDFIKEIHVQSVGASAEFGNVQGAVINVITRQGSDRFLYDAAYYGQTASLTSQPVLLPPSDSRNGTTEFGYEREKYQDVTTNLGGPIRRERLWFFAGYQYLRDYDSQPGTDPAYPRTYEQNKIFAKLNWKLAPNWRLMQSIHYERWVNPDRPTVTNPYEVTTRPQASVPAMTFGHLTHTVSPNTLWDVRVGRFVYSLESPPSTGVTTTASRLDQGTGIVSGAPPQFGGLTLIRTNAKVTLNHYMPALWGADHQWKFGGQIERGEHHAPSIIPTGERFVDNAGGAPFQRVSRSPAHDGAMFVTAAAFVSDAITVGDRLTINAGLRFDHTRAISQDLRTLDDQGNETDGTISGLGTLYTWNLFSPRLGVTAKLTADGRTIARASYGRFSQGVLTGELGGFHPAATPVTTTQFDPATGGYTRLISVVDARNLLIDRGIRAPYTDEFSVGVDRELGRRLAVAIAYVRKDGANFIGWTDVGGQYVEKPYPLPDGSILPVFDLVNLPRDRRFLLTNPDDYSMTYNGLVLAVDKRRSDGWQAFGSYTLSRASGLQTSSGTVAAGPQISSIAGVPFNSFGQDPNSLTNARGRLANDRPHVFRLMGSVDLPRTGLVVSGNLQYFTGKPWAATASIPLTQGTQRILLEPRGSRRLSSQTNLDLRVARPFALGGIGRVELILDVLNVLNEVSEEALTTDNLYAGSPTRATTNFGQPNVFIDPRRVMLGVRLNLGR